MTTLESIVVPLDLCKKWKEMGGEQKTVLVWIPFYGQDGELISWSVKERENVILKVQTREMLAAPTLGELMEWLKEKIAFVAYYKKSGWNVVDLRRGNYWDDNLASALMRMALEGKR